MNASVEQVSTCTSCGKGSPAHAKFCGQCGQGFPSIPPILVASPARSGLATRTKVILSSIAAVLATLILIANFGPKAEKKTAPPQGSGEIHDANELYAKTSTIKGRTLQAWKAFREATMSESQNLAKFDTLGLKIRLVRMDLDGVDQELVGHVKDWIQTLNQLEALFGELQTEARKRESYSADARTLGRIAGILGGSSDVQRDAYQGEIAGQVVFSILSSALGQEQEKYFIGRIGVVAEAIQKLGEEKTQLRQKLENRYSTTFL